MQQGHQSDFESRGAWSARPGIGMEFCCSVLATASFVKLLEYAQLKNGILLYIFLQKSIGENATYYYCRKLGGGSAPSPCDFDAPVQDYRCWVPSHPSDVWTMKSSPFFTFIIVLSQKRAVCVEVSSLPNGTKILQNFPHGTAL